ncbi:MAG: outer membrane beta-barrel protein [Bryobacteraceae bacterium]|jgi:opacity protein-like surface antigen
MPSIFFSYRSLIRGAIFAGILAAALPPRCTAQSDPAFHSCTAEIGGGYDSVYGNDGKNIDGRADFQAGGGFAATHHLFFTANFMYDAANIRTAALPVNEGGKARYYTTTVDPTYRFVPNGRISPYILGGFGWLRRSVELTGPPSPNPLIYPGNVPLQLADSNSGVFDLGAGLNFRLSKTGASLYLEGRYVHGLAINGHTTLVPVVLGIRW